MIFIDAVQKLSETSAPSYLAFESIVTSKQQLVTISQCCMTSHKSEDHKMAC